MNVILTGHGKMGRMIEELLHGSPDDEILGVVDIGLYENAMEVPGKADVLIDFSYPGNLEKTLDYAKITGCPLVIGTTGLTDAQKESIRRTAKQAPIVYSANYSVGVAVLRKALQLVAPMLMDSFDTEIVETHHRQKADAPSGTAKALLETIDPLGEYDHVFGREGLTGKRGKEIGVHALRGGTVAGEHSVFFFGEDESLEFRHTATSRRIFAAGAIRAAKFVTGQKPGLYGMDDVMEATRK